MQKFKINLHLHSYYSDGFYSPWFIVKAAKMMGIKALSITDHNEISGTIRGARHAKKEGIIFFPGIELMFLVKGRFYEVIAYFKDEETIREFFYEYRYGNGFVPHFKNVAIVVEMIRKHEGAVVAPHPFGRKGIFRAMRNRGMNVDAIEVINGFTGEKRNLKAKRHQDSDSKFLRLGASDMHFFIDDLLRVYTEVELEGELTPKELWQNIIGDLRTIKFTAVGVKSSVVKISFQEILCGIVYMLNYPRLYASYKIGKYYYKKIQKAVQDAELEAGESAA
jgi:hypothetical protein